jgi:ribosome-associated toxin RatA of RatAB toxin-antitoxin module
VVADVERYPEFVPFCVACVISSTETPDQAEIEWKESNPEGKLIFANTSVGFKLFKETYVSRIRLIPQKYIEVFNVAFKNAALIF